MGGTKGKEGVKKETVDMDFGELMNEEIAETPEDKAVDVDFGELGDKGIYDKPKPLPPQETVEDDAQLAGFHYTEAQQDYEQEEFRKKAAPVIQDAVKVQKESFHEIVNAEVDERIGEVSGHIKKHRKKKKKAKLIKWLIILGVCIFLCQSRYVRQRTAILYQDTKELVTGLINGEDVSSNRLALDLLDTFHIKHSQEKEKE